MRILPLMLAALLVIVPFGPIAAAPQVLVTVAAGAPGSPAALVLARLVSLISQTIPGVQAKVEVTAGPAANMLLIGSRRADLGYAGTPVAEDAYYGVGAFTGNRVPLRLLTPLWEIPTHLVTIEGTGINSIGELRGKRVSLGARGSPVERDALRILKAGGIEERDIRAERLGFDDAHAALREKRIDAYFYTDIASLPVSDILVTAMTPGIRLKLVPLDSVLAAMQKEFGMRYRGMTIRKEYYPGLSADVPTIGADFLVVAHEDLSLDLGYEITKLFFEKRGELARASREAQFISLLGVRGRSSVPFHPGAARYYKERGVGGF